MRTSSHHLRGFTLIELLVAITVIAVLLSMLFPVLTLVREQARSVNCLSNIRQMSGTFVAFAGEHDGRFPHVVSTKYNALFSIPWTHWHDLIIPYQPWGKA